ncbi:hypothetical protein BC829DRAFT_389452 [Chytridium lagenaria]|nr:hypothetical protein BC829DRAFT_389452 [Chytridium lagenaria]
MKLLLNDGRADPASNSNEPLSLACLNNNLPAVRLLLTDPRVTPTPRALLNAITANNPFIVQELLDTGKIDPSHSDNAPFRAACRLAILPVIKLLCADTRVDPSARECEGLVDAVAANRVDVVKFLMTVESIDVMTRNLYCLKECFEKCYWDMARVLISHHSMDLGSVVEMYHWPNFHMLESLLE